VMSIEHYDFRELASLCRKIHTKMIFFGLSIGSILENFDEFLQKQNDKAVTVAPKITYPRGENLGLIRKNPKNPKKSLSKESKLLFF